jgi:hypothetical protein
LLAQPVAALACQSCDKPVWHCSVRAAPEDRTLSDSEWAQVAAGIMHRTGLAARRPARHPRRTEQAARRGWRETPRAALQREVCTAAAGAGTEQEFFTRLRKAGVLVRLRHSTTIPDQETGYAVGLAPHTARDGGVIWYGGGKLAADLTLPKLRARWHPPAGHDPFSAAELPASAVRAVLRNKVTTAAQQVRDETGFVARLRKTGVLVRVRFSKTDPAQVTGYAVALPGHTGPDGAPRWYGGGRLAAGLTLPQLRRDWAQAPSDAPERGAAFWFTARNGTRSTSMRPARPRRPRSTSAAAPTASRPQRPTPRGRRPTRCMSRRGRCAARSCAAQPTPTIAPRAPVTAGSPAAAMTGTACAPRRGCWPSPVTSPTTPACSPQR